MNYDFVLTTNYNEGAYRALSEASWQLFRKPKLQTQAYPVLIAGALLTLAAAAYNFTPTLMTAAVALATFFLAAIPLSGVSARAKMYRTAVKAANANGDFPAQVRFVFGKDTIHTTVGKHASIIPYGKVVGFAALGSWRFLYFDETAAYILHTSTFSGPEEVKRFASYIDGKCQTPLVQLKGDGPLTD